MLRLRKLIEGGLENPWLRFGLLLLLAILAMFIVIQVQKAARPKQK